MIFQKTENQTARGATVVLIQMHMKNIKVNLKQNPYNIVVGHNILKSIGMKIKPLKLGQDAIVITSPVIRKYHGKTLLAGLKKGGFNVKVFEVPDGEQSKSAKVVFALMEKIVKFDVFKQPFIVAFGGGVIGDLAGYVAAAYKRGIPYIQVPTTFLAQVDSAIGGKVAIDLPVGKNLVGAFYQPKVVFSDVATLSTLPEKEICNGSAEAVKYGIIYDPQLFTYIEKNYDKLLAKDSKVLTKIVVESSRIKANVVMADEKETKGIREILNFGHTVGHAIEAAGHYRVYQHGQAIGLGMRIAADISHQLKLISAVQVEHMNQLISAVGLPKSIKKTIKIADILSHMKHDKKFKFGKNRFVLTTKIGKVKLVEGVSMDVIKKAIKAYY